MCNKQLNRFFYVACASSVFLSMPACAASGLGSHKIELAGQFLKLSDERLSQLETVRNKLTSRVSKKCPAAAAEFDEVYARDRYLELIGMGNLIDLKWEIPNRRELISLIADYNSSQLDKSQTGDYEKNRAVGDIEIRVDAWISNNKFATLAVLAGFESVNAQLAILERECRTDDR
jgi:hypothetical protein